MIDNLKLDYFFEKDFKEMYSILLKQREGSNCTISSSLFKAYCSKLIQEKKTSLSLMSICEIETFYDDYSRFHQYSKIIRESYSKHKIRSIILSLKDSVSVENVDEIIALCDEINNYKAEKDTAVCFKDAMQLNKEKALLISQGELKVKLLYSGFAYLDFLIQGWAEGELIIISARTGMGKTRFATNLIESICKCKKNKGESVYFFSLEESVEKITNLIMAKNTGINSRRLKSYNLGDRLNDYLNVQISCDLYINACRSEADIRKIKNTIESYSKKGVKNYFIDTLNSVKRNHKESEKDALDTLSRTLKDLAVQYGVRLFVLAQNNREADKRPEKEKTPTKADVKGSDEIVHHADSMISLYKPAYYKKEITDTAEDIYCVSVTKTRDGIERSLDFEYDLGLCRFEEKKDYNMEAIIRTDAEAIISKRR